MSETAANLSRLSAEIETAAVACGRDPAGIHLLAVSKTFPLQAIEEARRWGQVRFGENRVQEAESKIPNLAGTGVDWHLIGPLQTNKARRAAELFQVIQTLDRPKLARHLNRHAAELDRRLRVYVQVNLAAEPQKHGVTPEAAAALVELVDELPHLDLEGLMAIPPFAEDPEMARPFFRRLAGLRVELGRSRGRPLAELSMGMSHDYPVAIQEGATLLRIGTAIFGPRMKG